MFYIKVSLITHRGTLSIGFFEEKLAEGEARLPSGHQSSLGLDRTRSYRS